MATGPLVRLSVVRLRDGAALRGWDRPQATKFGTRKILRSPGPASRPVAQYGFSPSSAGKLVSSPTVGTVEAAVLGPEPRCCRGGSVSG
jgi:hypothetical protein